MVFHVRWRSIYLTTVLHMVESPKYAIIKFYTMLIDRWSALYALISSNNLCPYWAGTHT